MNRRGFLKALGAGAVGVVATPAILEALAPTRSIFLPPRGGWLVNRVEYYGTTRGRWAYGGAIHENLVQTAGREMLERYQRNVYEHGVNAGVPGFLTNYFDPKLLEVLVEPMKAHSFDYIQHDWIYSK
jgi:hypothetical protein